MAERVTFSTAPYVTIRFNQLPYTALTPAVSADAIAHRLSRLHGLTRWRRDSRPGICDVLYRLAASTPSDLLTSVLLPLKRDIFNDRLTQIPLEAIGRLTDDSCIARWYEVQREIGQLETEIDAWYTATSEAERRALQQACADDRFLQALAVSSRLAYDATHRYVTTPVPAHGSKIRRSEPNILQYLTRAMTRTTPFSLYTSIAVARWADAGIAQYPFEILDGPVSAAVADHSLVRRFLDAVSTHPATAKLMSYGVCPDLRASGDTLLFDIGVDDPVKQPRVFRTAVKQGAVKLTPAVRAFIGWMRTNGSPVKPYAEIVGALEGSFGTGSRERAEAFVDQFIAKGLLIADVPIPEHTDRILADAAVWLATLPSPLCEMLAGTVRAIDERMVGFDRAPAASRAARMKRVEEGWRTAFAALDRRQPDSVLVYEDSVAPATLHLQPGLWTEAIDDLKRLVSALEVFDTKPALKALACDEFVKQFGVGGTCDDVRAFAALIPRIYDRLFRAWVHDPSEPIHRTHPALKIVAELGLRFHDRLCAQIAAGTDEVELDGAFLDEISAAIPDFWRRDWASFSLFVQPTVSDAGAIDRLVVNQIYGGLGVFMTRFLPLLDDAAVDGLRTHLHSFFPADAMVAELRPVAGFNGNLHAPLTEFEIDGDGGAGRTIDSANLRFRHDAESMSIEITDASTGRQVIPLYLGVMVPFLLPEKQRLLYSLSGSGQVNVAFHLLAERALDAEARKKVRRYPRVSFGKVVLHRKRWYVPRALLPHQAQGESDARYLVRLNLWRLDEGLPSTVFLHEHPQRSAMEQAADPEEWRQRFTWARSKPQFIDFQSGLFVRYLAKWLRTTNPANDVYVEEVLPEFSQSVSRSGPHPRVMETIVEINRRAEGWSA